MPNNNIQYTVLPRVSRDNTSAHTNLIALRYKAHSTNKIECGRAIIGTYGCWSVMQNEAPGSWHVCCNSAPFKYCCISISLYLSQMLSLLFSHQHPFQPVSLSTPLIHAVVLEISNADFNLLPLQHWDHEFKTRPEGGSFSIRSGFLCEELIYLPHRIANMK
jgi:hypothetical protein